MRMSMKPESNRCHRLDRFSSEDYYIGLKNNGKHNYSSSRYSSISSRMIVVQSIKVKHQMIIILARRCGFGRQS